MFLIYVYGRKVLFKTPKNFDVKKARLIQKIFSKKVLFKKIDLEKVVYVGGVDVSYKDNQATVVAVILNFKTLNVLEVKKLKLKTYFPYIPTLLAFREAPPIFKVVKTLTIQPDVLMVEGHGIAHPFGCGLACHVGVVLKMPTIGVAKKLLFGKMGKYKENKAPIFWDKKIVGMAIIPKPQSKPIYVSVGNLITLNQAVKIVEKCIKKGRMPEPLRLAHLFTKE